MFYKDYVEEIKEDLLYIFTEDAIKMIVFIYIFILSPLVAARELYDYIWTWIEIIKIKIILYKLKKRNNIK